MMKYAVIALLYLISVYSFFVLNFYHNGWQYVQPFLITVLLVYFNTKNEWLYYAYAFLSGLFIDSFTGIFGLYTASFLLIIFILRTLQISILTSKNILSIAILSILAFVFHNLFFWAINFVIASDFYNLERQPIYDISKAGLLNFFIIIICHLLYFNIWLRKRDYEGQSF